MEEQVNLDEWYKCKIDKKIYKELTKRSDWQGIKHVSIWIFFLWIITGGICPWYWNELGDL